MLNTAKNIIVIYLQECLKHNALLRKQQKQLETDLLK